jgi:NAD(P)-dependent dehydrogenase (short-subunit alcohol dehydrogenase family)
VLFSKVIRRNLLAEQQIVGAKGQPHPLDVWNLAVDINLTGTFNLTRIACKHLVNVPIEGPDGERGVVVMVASSAAVRSCPAPLFFLSLFVYWH